MPYLHVLASFAEAPDKPKVLFSDLSEDQLKERFVKPYKKGRDFLVANEVVRVAQLRKCHIVRTERTEEIERAEFNAKDRARIDEINRQPGGVVFISLAGGYEPEDLIEIGTDVTGAYILGAPGYGARGGVLGAVFNHPWVLRVGGSLIAAGLLWLAKIWWAHR